MRQIPILLVMSIACEHEAVKPIPILAQPPATSASRHADAPADAGRDFAPTRILRYRELFTGSLPFHARIETWTLAFDDDGRVRLEHEKAEADENSLRVGVSKPLTGVRIVSHDTKDGTWSKADSSIELRFAGEEVVRCAETQVSVLAAGALLVVPPHRHAPWRPAGRETIAVLGCDREWLAAEASWSDEPQPARLPFAPLPGIEYAHDNDDMVIQQGGLRRIRP